MIRVIFYFLEFSDASAELFACRLVNKGWRKGLTIHLHTADQAQCCAMDRLLWAWREDSFLPHSIISQSLENIDEEIILKESPITLGFSEPVLDVGSLLINLDSSVPFFYKNFIRICEIVIQQDDSKTVSREKYRSYLRHGIKPELHRVSNKVHYQQ